MRRTIAVILLVAAAAGLVYGLLGATAKSVKIHSGNTQGVYSFEDNSYKGTVGVSSAGGLSMGMSDIRKLAESQRSRQMWLGFGACALLGIVGGAMLRKPLSARGLPSREERSRNMLSEESAAAGAWRK